MDGVSSSTMSTAAPGPAIETRGLSPVERTVDRSQGWPLVLDGHGASLRALLSTCEARRAELRASLLRHGALLLRGFGVSDPGAFRQVLDALGLVPSPFPYAGNTLRPETAPGVHAVTDAPAWTCIYPHNEMFYWYRQPATISFWCERSDGRHGETPIVDCRAVWRDLPEDLQQRLEDARFYVVSRYPSQDRARRNPLSLGTQLANTWQAVGGTADPAAFEAMVHEGGGTVTWTRGGTACVRVDNALEVDHPQTGEPVWRGLGLDPLVSTRVFNRHVLPRLAGAERLKCRALGAGAAVGSRVQRRIGLTRGDVSRADVWAMYEAAWRNSALFRWQPGDVLVVDNVSMGHGRMNVDGPRRLHVVIGGEVRLG